MRTLSFEITDRSRIPFIMDLLSHFDYIRELKTKDLMELIEEEGLVRAMKEAEKENEYLNREEALKYLEEDED